MSKSGIKPVDALIRLQSYKKDVLGVKEMSWILGISIGAIGNRLRKKYPLPIFTRIGCGPIWMINEVRRWLCVLKFAEEAKQTVVYSGERLIDGSLDI